MEFANIRHSCRLYSRVDEYLEIEEDGEFDSLLVCNIMFLKLLWGRGCAFPALKQQPKLRNIQ